MKKGRGIRQGGGENSAGTLAEARQQGNAIRQPITTCFIFVSSMYEENIQGILNTAGG